MNNKAEALRNLSAPSFEVRDMLEAGAAQRLRTGSLPEAVLCLSPVTVTSRLMVPLQGLGEIPLNCSECLQILNSSCFEA